MRLRAVAVASAAVLAILAGCSGGTTEPTASDTATTEASEQTPTTSPSPTAASSPTQTATSPGNGSSPLPGSTQVSGADGALTWAMPCANPRDEEIEGNEKDKQTYSGFHGWACGQGDNATAGAIVTQLVKTPADDDAAHREMRAVLEQLAEGGKPTHGTFQGHPGVTVQTEQNGRTAGFQGVSFGNYIAVFFTIPADNLDQLTDTIEISD